MKLFEDPDYAPDPAVLPRFERFASPKPRILMQGGKWLVPPAQRPKVRIPPDPPAGQKGTLRRRGT